MVSIIKTDYGHAVAVDGKEYAKILAVPGAVDTFEPIEDGAWRWLRKTDVPTDKMRMEMMLVGEPTFTMVPAISYNGNGWGSLAEYIGDRDTDGTPWSWASHRGTIPSCTYSENDEISIALMAKENDNNACSLYKVDEGEMHVVIFPEEEKPRTLQRHFWGEPFEGTMEPKCDFEAIILAVPSDGTKHRYKSLLDFAWRYYGHAIAAPRTAKELYRLSMAYTRYLYEEEKNGFSGFTVGSQWYPGSHSYKKNEHRYELGWVGQSASMANAYIWDYIQTGDKEMLDKGIGAHDNWLKFGKIAAGIIGVKVDYDPWRKVDFENMKLEDIDRYSMGECMYETYRNFMGKKLRRNADGLIDFQHDACNLGTGADGYFEAYDLLKEIGIEKPEYLKTAYDICDFAIERQDEEGSYAKSWNSDGTLRAKKGTIGTFLVLPILTAYKKSGDKKYLDSAVKAFDFYYQGLERDGFTTAGALDTYSIDKESSSPLLRDALALYEITGDKEYVRRAEKIAWYLCTWMMYYTVKYPEDCLITKMGYDTFGSTSVSTPHQAMDQYALRDVLSFLKLYEITGYKQWRERAIAFWCNACQCISDGTQYINGRIRPAGAQDEAVFHTRWGRYGVPPFSPSQWLPAWPCAFRLESLRWHKDWSFFDEGLTEIEGKIAR
ncbi:MAG: AGE family epimerase/isomerase [Clostridia bacterium]|nr:AGE family epimerase/isomerase [Clostridia bacterium]MBR0326829.1 AGE family epimerase/isomerase [Clostridia bacterium]